MAELRSQARNFTAEKVANIPKPEATVDKVEPMDIGRDCLEYKADVSVMNPYGHSIRICEISYSLKSADREIVSGKIPKPGSLKAADTTVLDEPVKVPHSILASLAMDTENDWNSDCQLNLGLVVDLPIVGNITIPVSSKWEIKLPSLLDIILARYGVKTKSEDEVVVVAVEERTLLCKK